MSALLEISEAAEYVNRCVKTLQKLDRKGVLVAARTHTNRRIYTVEQLDAFLHGHPKPPRHGEGVNRTPEFRAWEAMLRRCSNRGDKRWPRYGGRGITVCDRWRTSYTAFLSDMGRRPTSQHTLDRADNNGPYSPENCRWATYSEQANNTSRTRHFTFDGKTKTLSEWAEEIGVASTTLDHRLRALGWSIERTLSTPTFSHSEAGTLGNKNRRREAHPGWTLEVLP